MKVISIKNSICVLLFCSSLFLAACSSSKKASDASKNKEGSITEIPVSTSVSGKEYEDVFTIVEEPATYPDGGMDGFYKYVAKNMVYLEQAKKMEIEGRVFVVFIVQEDGEITNVQIARGIGGGCDEEAERLVRESEKWIPAKQRGKNVKVRMNIPIVFKLD